MRRLCLLEKYLMMRACQSAEKQQRLFFSLSPVVRLPVGWKETVLVVVAKQFAATKINVVLLGLSVRPALALLPWKPCVWACSGLLLRLGCYPQLGQGKLSIKAHVVATVLQCSVSHWLWARGLQFLAAQECTLRALVHGPRQPRSWLGQS